MTTGEGGDALTSQFNLDFTLISCMGSTGRGSVWYLDSSVSFHMTKNKELFINLEEKDLKLHIELGDDGMYSTMGLALPPLRGS